MLLLVVFSSPPPFRLDLGSPGDARSTHLFFSPEQSDEITFRWSSPASQLVFHGTTGGSAALRMHLNGELLATSTDPRLHLNYDGQTVATFGVSSGWRVYTVLLPSDMTPRSIFQPLILDLESETYNMGANDDRLLGVPVDWVELTPLPGQLVPHGLSVQRLLLLLIGLAALTLLFWTLDCVIWACSQPFARALRVSGVVSIFAAALVVWATRDPYGLAMTLPASWLLGGTALLLLMVLGGRWLRTRLTDAVIGRPMYAGLFMVALATLMYEILLTRIFSVTMFYHFAFVAISIAMFGMTLGAVLVYLLPQVFTPERARQQLVWSSLLFAITIFFSFLTHLAVPFSTDTEVMWSLVGIYALLLTYVAISVPFVCSGIAITLALTKFPRHVSTLYASDLAGAALGCILVIYTLNITDGPTAVVVVALLASIGAGFFALQDGMRQLRVLTGMCGLVFLTLVVSNMALLETQSPFLRLVWVRGEKEQRPLYEAWNSFSRIKIYGDPDERGSPFAWGLSSTYSPDRRVRQLFMQIDSEAGAVLEKYHGDVGDIEHLKYDVTNIAHYVRTDADVLVVGTGGGRDILSALAFDQQSVTGVEINRNIIDSVNREFGHFTGYLNEDPRVTFVNDEARSWIARQDREFDILQISLIDTWAATTAGAFVFTENALYTVEAWEIFLDHLTPHGVLTVSRWYFADGPGEVYRLTALASTALMRQGIANPRDHIVIVRVKGNKGAGDPDGVGTILVSQEPFSKHDLDTIETVAQRMQFEIVLSPRIALNENFVRIASGQDLAAFTASFPINIAPPTDNNPFFFHMLRLGDVFSPSLQYQGVTSYNMNAVAILGILLAIVIGLTLVFIIVPLVLRGDRTSLRGSFPLLLYFAGIGFGFMLVEISQMQRLTVFLGHPTYGLSVVLFTVLLSSGLGSFLTRRVHDPEQENVVMVLLSALLGMLVIFGTVTPALTHFFQESSTLLRILVAVGILFPLGLFMGMAFPLGMKLAAARSEALTPWLWGINGSTSVCASVLAVAIALMAGISASFWMGVICYSIAVVAFSWARRSTRMPILSPSRIHVTDDA
jgi:hypothetical protein